MKKATARRRSCGFCHSPIRAGRHSWPLTPCERIKALEDRLRKVLGELADREKTEPAA